MNCNYCNKPESGQLLFIEGYCHDCLERAHKSSNLPIMLIVSMIKDGMKLA